MISEKTNKSGNYNYIDTIHFCNNVYIRDHLELSSQLERTASPMEEDVEKERMPNDNRNQLKVRRVKMFDNIHDHT